MNSRKRILLIIFSVLAAWTIAYYQFNNNVQKHSRIINNGKVVKAVSTYNEHLWVGYAHFSFITDKGIKVEENRKCGDKKTFDRDYANLVVIYNSENIQEYETMRDFTNYSLTWLRIFFFGIYPVGITLVFFGLFRFIYIISKKFKQG